MCKVILLKSRNKFVFVITNIHFGKQLKKVSDI